MRVGTDVLKRARECELFSRTIMPIYALYMAGWVIGRSMYLASGRLGLSWGPLGPLRRAVAETQPVRTLPASGWMDWIAVVLWGVFLVAELKRRWNRRHRKEPLLLAAYLVATLAAASVVLARDLAEAYYGVMAILAASMFTLARWRRWTPKVRWIALAALAGAAGISLALLRLRDMAHLGQLSG